ncbi:hypothetical protein BECAL_03407 [Bellilinea caldifistulae]|uniref:Uncharacterized protein n=1 Tax=Bellilinea caldifistulae TaxID=360411 RepID=A0A0P6X4M6_9CHLR|nr:hypothetical protein [Bellilinea caldifistulae]KPL76631.1 hypothetical protein AC812_04730 [Bellilinea caldifistulae]GAP12203.1 hypothetical protein BECAL_03407 [Bellilinea caldifistulae]
MEIEIDAREFSVVAAIVAVNVLILLGVLGWLFTPEGGKVLTYAEWQIHKAERAYRQELRDLQKTCEEMAALLDKPLDPLRVQVAADRILNEMAKGGQAVLQPQREAVAAAAQALRNWAMGDSRERAVEAVAEASRRVAEVSGGSLP